MEEKMKEWFFTLAIISLLISCKKEKKEEIMPLNCGNYWNYQGLIIENGDTILIDTFKMKVIIQLGDTFYLTGALFTFEELAEDETIKVLLLESLLLSYIYDIPDTQLVLPLKIGKSWRVNEEFMAEVIGKEDVSIGNTEYSDCWRIKYQGDEDIQKELWFKEEIGIVKFRKEEEEEIIILELKEYNIKK